MNLLKWLAPIPSPVDCVAHIVHSNQNVIMYDVTIDHEIMGYFVGINSNPPAERLVEFTEREAAEDFYSKLNVRVEMAKRGICLN